LNIARSADLFYSLQKKLFCRSKSSVCWN